MIYGLQSIVNLGTEFRSVFLRILGIAVTYASNLLRLGMIHDDKTHRRDYPDKFQYQTSQCRQVFRRPGANQFMVNILHVVIYFTLPAVQA